MTGGRVVILNDSEGSLYCIVMKQYYAYIVTNRSNRVLYTGVTNNLARRMYEHKQKFISGFTSKYNVSKLVWYESFFSPGEAIAAEKKIKGWRRDKKLSLVVGVNPGFRELEVI